MLLEFLIWYLFKSLVLVVLPGLLDCILENLEVIL